MSVKFEKTLADRELLTQEESRKVSRKRNVPIEVRYWKKVVQGNPGECWGWSGSASTAGYGKLSCGRKNEGEIHIHRFSWIIHFGDIPDGLFVLHKCDNPICSNPDHLFLGTAKDNSDDMSSKQRNVTGEDHHNAKLTDDDVRMIRKLYIPKVRGTRRGMRSLAKMFKVDKDTIRAIIAGETWKNVE